MANQMELSVRTGLNKLIQELDKLKGEAKELEQSFKTAGSNIGAAMEDSVKKTERTVTDSRSLMRRALDQLKGDIKSLFALESLASGLKLSDQFKSSIKETIGLSDTIRKLGSVFGMAEKDFSSFQTKLTKGMGDIGLSSNSAANALQGLSETPVRGQEALTEYAKLAGTIAQISGQRGQEGAIGKGIAKIIQARGGNVQDIGQARGVSEDILRARLSTGKGATEIVSAMEEIFTHMSDDLRKKIGTKGLAQVAAVSQIGGPGATKFFEQFTALSKTQRAGLEARGLGKLIGPEGINVDALKQFAAEAKKLGGGDFRLGIKAMGIEGDDAAEGFARLSENLEQVSQAADKFNKQQVDMSAELTKSMGLGEAFQASVNRIKAAISGPLSSATQGLTGILAGASKSGAGAAAVVGGGGVLAALLAGAGLRGLGKGLGIGGGLGGIAKGAVGGAIASQAGATPVYVVNASEISGGSGIGDMAGGLLGKIGGFGTALGIAGGAAGVGLAGLGGYKAGEAINELPGVSDAIVGAMEKIASLFGGGPMGNEEAMRVGASRVQKPQEVHVKLNDRRLEATKQPARGASTGAH
jgi:hypothetical protein